MSVIYKLNTCRHMRAIAQCASMDSPRQGILDFLVKLCRDYPNKSPYIFASRQFHLYGQGFDQLRLKVFEAESEMVIPNALCINADVLNCLSASSTRFHISKYMEASGRSATVGPDIDRTLAIILMVSCIGYSFCSETFPYCKNWDIMQMWADIRQMTLGNHVACNLIDIAMRGRSSTGFAKQHAPRSSVPPISILEPPQFSPRPKTVSPWQPPPPPPRQQPPPPPPPRKSSGSVTSQSGANSCVG